MSIGRLNTLVWFALLGGALGWAVQFLAGLELGFARCESPNGRFQPPLPGWAIALAAAGVLLGVVAEGVAIAVFRATREKGSLSAERIHFLATIAMTVNPLMLTISAMSGVGVSLLPICHQS